MMIGPAMSLRVLTARKGPWAKLGKQAAAKQKAGRAQRCMITLAPVGHPGGTRGATPGATGATNHGPLQRHPWGTRGAPRWHQCMLIMHLYRGTRERHP